MRRTFRDNAAEGQQRLLLTVMRKKTLLAFEELERALDLRAKLLGRLQLAVDDDDDKSASEAIGERERSGRDRGNVNTVAKPAVHRVKLKNGY
jgi:hypothetical protein